MQKPLLEQAAPERKGGLMLTADERLALVRTKIHWAKQRIVELELFNRAFLDTIPSPYEIGTKRDPNTRQLIYYMVRVDSTPDEFSLLTGDILHNIRGALDHLAFRLCELTGFTDSAGNPLTPTQMKQISFPIVDTDSPTEYEATRARKVKAMRQDAIDAIDALKPYKGGNDLLWRLHRLNNVDKHRLLITASSAYRNVNVASWFDRLNQKMFAELGADPELAATMKIPDMFLRPRDRKFPLEAGDELFIDLPDAELDENMPFTFEIAISESGVIDCEPLIETLHNMAQAVDDIIVSFKPLLV